MTQLACAGLSALNEVRKCPWEVPWGARRKFADILKSGVSDTNSKVYAKEAIALIQKLYKIEKEIKEMPPDKKYLVRREKFQPIINTMRDGKDIEALLPWNVEGEEMVRLG